MQHDAVPLTLIDRLVGWASPKAGLHRYWNRRLLTRAYEAASPRDKWRPRRPGASADADHFADASRLRAKSRALYQNVPYVRAGIEARVAHIVGTGITPKFTGRHAARLNALWRQWAPQADADGLRDVYGLQAGAVRTMDVDGEVLVRIRMRRPEDGLAVPLQLQLLEIDWLDTLRQHGQGGNEVRGGIEYDALGRVVAYWLWPRHPGDVRPVRGTSMQSQRVDARWIIHLFAPERPGQGRGFPRISSIIPRVRDLQTYEDADLARKNLESRISVLASGDLSGLDNAEGAARGDGEVGSLGELPSGSIMRLPPGANLTLVDPKPSTGYVDYVRLQLHLIAAGGGWTYEQSTGDMSQVNFSAARMRAMDFRREVEATQWLTVIPMLCSRICAAFAEAAYLGGLVRTAAYGVEHTPPRWEYVNPEQDIASELAAVAGGLMSISECIRRRGDDPETVFSEWSSDIKRLRDAGLLDVMLALLKARAADADRTRAPAEA